MRSLPQGAPTKATLGEPLVRSPPQISSSRASHFSPPLAMGRPSRARAWPRTRAHVASGRASAGIQESLPRVTPSRGRIELGGARHRPFGRHVAEQSAILQNGVNSHGPEARPAELAGGHWPGGAEEEQQRRALSPETVAKLRIARVTSLPRPPALGPRPRASAASGGGLFLAARAASASSKRARPAPAATAPFAESPFARLLSPRLLSPKAPFAESPFAQLLSPRRVSFRPAPFARLLSPRRVSFRPAPFADPPARGPTC